VLLWVADGTLLSFACLPIYIGTGARKEQRKRQPPFLSGEKVEYEVAFALIFLPAGRFVTFFIKKKSKQRTFLSRKKVAYQTRNNLTY
jgi:hypothetical protein